jgi:hypothetical protein
MSIRVERDLDGVFTGFATGAENLDFVFHLFDERRRDHVDAQTRAPQFAHVADRS